MATQVPVYNMPRSGKKIPTLERTPPAEPALLDPEVAASGLMSLARAEDQSAQALGAGMSAMATSLANDSLAEIRRSNKAMHDEA